MPKRSIWRSSLHSAPYLSRLFGYAFSLTNERDLALELVQDCMVKVLAAARRGWLPEQIEGVSSKYALEGHPPPLEAPNEDGAR